MTVVAIAVQELAGTDEPASTGAPIQMFACHVSRCCTRNISLVVVVIELAQLR